VPQGPVAWAIVLTMAWLWGGPQAGAAAAATFTVDPTQIFLSGRSGSVLLTLRNESNETLQFQLSVFAWTQSPSGEMQLEPTEARVATYFTVFTEIGLDHFGRYRDVFVPVGDDWLIRHRFVSTDWSAPDSTMAR